MNVERFVCCVCGFRELTEPARRAGGGGSFEICPSCGFQIGVTDDDRGYTYEAWGELWIALGYPW